MKTVYAPLLVLDCRVHIFDHPNGELRSFEPDGVPTGTVRIGYPAEKRWKPEVFADAQGSRAFTLFTRNGFPTLAEIDLNSGATTRLLTLDYAFTKKIRVQGQEIFFLYRDDQEGALQRLYRGRLN